MKYSREEVMQYVREEDVKFIRLAFCDVFGRQKNISIMAECRTTWGLRCRPRQRWKGILLPFGR